MKNLHCQKRRRVVTRDKDGNKRETQRCANGISKHYSCTVNESVCRSCTIRRSLLGLVAICKERPPKNPIWLEPIFNEAGDIIYPHQEGTEQPPEPQGYERKGDWSFESKWETCSYHQFANQLTPKGDLQVTALCGAQKGRTVTCEDCKKCLRDLEQIGGSLNTETIEDSVPLPEPIRQQLGNAAIPNFPGATELLDNYWKAVKRWIAAGRPVRNNNEVRKIHEEFCKSCDWYDKKSSRCKGCGCAARPKGMAMLNKIKMKTEHCPRKFW